METRRNILKDKKGCLVCWKVRNISKYCFSKSECYKCSIRYHVVIYHFKKIGNNNQVSKNYTPNNDDSKKEEINVNVNSASIFTSNCHHYCRKRSAEAEFFCQLFPIFVYLPTFKRMVERKNYYFSWNHDESSWQSNFKFHKKN